MNSVNHDLRTPLNYLMNSNYLINEDGQSYLNEQKNIYANLKAKFYNDLTQENSICLVLIDEMIKFLEKTIVETNVIFNVVDHIELVLKSMAEFAMLDPKNLDFNIEEIDINDCISNIFKIYSETK